MLHTIFKGQHFSFPPLLWLYFGRKEFIWHVTFDESCMYNNGDDAINKLVGVRADLFSNHKNSARFGWRWNTQKTRLDIMAYCYLNGVRIGSGDTEKWVASVSVSEVLAKKTVKCRLRLLTHSYVFEVYDINNKLLGTQSVLKKHKSKIYFKSHPYFGGKKTAPHEIKIKIS